MRFEAMPLSRRALLASACGLSACASPTPRLNEIAIPVQAWGGDHPTQTTRTHTIERITLHHQGVVWRQGSDVEAYLRRLQKWSRDAKSWADIPYHYIVSMEGRVYAARPEHIPGDTNTEYDPSGHLLVMLMGNFEEQEVTAEQWSATVAFVAERMRRHSLGLETLGTHRDYSKQTTCPGRNLLSRITPLRSEVAQRLAI
jgi:hypothetical protein